MVVLLVAAGFGGWLLRGGDDEKSAAKDEIRVGVPVIVSPAELKEFAGDHEQVYWAGERPGTHIESHPHRPQRHLRALPAREGEGGLEGRVPHRRHLRRGAGLPEPRQRQEERRRGHPHAERCCRRRLQEAAALDLLRLPRRRLPDRGLLAHEG
ncbi:hypothetical protein G5V59_20580 [Nocardioides sp. W3-2-3]|uniref:hypothetical protein n=1 Tax=Nocardioides convexus TaxID=2712224 RepID=UPI0024185E3E|nr:hypothetical protein [Nocardioides convexus]NHA01420.1 hypothetical protein [Nocardioides convexus]